MTMPGGGFLSALGGAFRGYAQDDEQRQQRVRTAQQDAEAARLREAQIDEYKAQAAQRQAEEARRAGNQRTIESNWAAAAGGDRNAQGGIVAAEPGLAGQFAPKPPPDNWKPTGSVDASGVPYIMDSRTGDTKLGMGTLPGKGGNLGAADAQDAALRVSAAARESRSANERMRLFEDRLIRKDANIGAFKTFLASVGQNVSTTGGTIDKGKAAVAWTMLQKMDSDVAQYFTDALTLAESSALISKRPSDFRTKLDQFLSGARGEPSEENIRAITNRREGMVRSMIESARARGIDIERDLGGSAYSSDGKFTPQIGGTGNILTGSNPLGQGGGDPHAAQRAEYDAAAAHLRSQGKDPVSILGVRP